MSWGIVASVGGAIVGGVISSKGSKDAANTQADAARDAARVQKEMFDRQVELQEPWRQAGQAGLNRLMTMMGLDTGVSDASPSSPTAGSTTSTAAVTTDREAIRERLLPQYTTPGAQKEIFNTENEGPGASIGYQTTGDVIDENALQAAIDREVATAAAQQQATQPQADPASDPDFGSLMRAYGETPPEYEKFTLDDYEADPGYLFRLSEGEKALERSAAARGGALSGRALKELARYSQGVASDEYGRAYGRYNDEYDRSYDQYTDAYNRYNTDQGNQYNRLASVAGIGQTATGQLTSATRDYGNSAASNIIGAGNAAAAGRVGSANALNNAIGQGVSSYQTNQLFQRMNNPNASYGGYGITGGGGFGTGNAWGNQDYGTFL